MPRYESDATFGRVVRIFHSPEQVRWRVEENFLPKEARPNEIFGDFDTHSEALSVANEIARKYHARIEDERYA